MWVRGCKANGAVHIVNYIIFYNDSLIISYVLIAQLDRVFATNQKVMDSNPERVSGVEKTVRRTVFSREV